MDNLESAELARRDIKGKDFSCLTLTLRADGSIEFYAQDIGAGVKECFGRDEYECWSIIDANAVGRLAFALLRDKCAGNVSAGHDVRDYCEEHGIECRGGAF